MKTIRVLIVIIIILAIILGIKILSPKKNNAKKELKKEEVKEIVAKSENIDNYVCEYKNGEQNIIRKYNNKKEYLQINEKIYYIDYEKNENIGIIKDSKKAVIIGITTNGTIETLKNDFYTLAEKAEEYVYVGEEEYKGRDCIVIELNYKYEEIEGFVWFLDDSEVEKINEENKNEKITNKIWIAKEEGVILKVVSNLKNEEAIQEYNFEFNCVSDAEVESPDLSGYEIIDTRKK